MPFISWFHLCSIIALYSHTSDFKRIHDSNYACINVTLLINNVLISIDLSWLWHFTNSFDKLLWPPYYSNSSYHVMRDCISTSLQRHCSNDAKRLLLLVLDTFNLPIVSYMKCPLGKITMILFTLKLEQLVYKHVDLLCR